MTNNFTQPLLNWFDQHGRKNLPWQKNINPYRVWVSEIMLQQTQVTTVIPYYERFMQHYPTVVALANASEDEVLSLWTGLGYYSRARNLLRTAKIICQQYAGEFPATVEELAELPGIGRSTAGAIAAIAFAKPTPILDGNVKRVLTRFHAIDGWPGQKDIENKLWQIATKYTDVSRPAAYTQAIMDLGATLCKRTQPQCHHCPLQTNCQAYAQGQATAYPKPKLKTAPMPVRRAYFLLLQNNNGKILLTKRPPQGIWASLWSLPECPIDEDVKAWCQTQLQIKINTFETWPSFRHTFSHYHLDIVPIYSLIKSVPSLVQDTTQYAWQTLGEKLPGGIATPIHKLLLQLSSTEEAII